MNIARIDTPALHAWFFILHFKNIVDTTFRVFKTVISFSFRFISQKEILYTYLHIYISWTDAKVVLPKLHDSTDPLTETVYNILQRN